MALFVAWTMGVISPGPDLVCVLHRSLRGRGQGVGAALGVVTGIAIWIVAAFAGLATLLRAAPGLQTVLQAAGGIVLVGLGLQALYGVWRSESAETSTPTGGSSPQVDERREPATETESLFTAFAAGLATNLSNPKALVFFGALLTPLLDAGAGPGRGVVAAAGVMAGMVVVALAWFLTVATMAAGVLSRARPAGVERVVGFTAGVLFVAFGATFAMWALRG